ncbi:hypothetical protein DDD_2487 [Nonlabens dokdonensis DSW-6]|uniref:Uncharacterized protein n=1 Tax=Nonlabens dokdonensis (strain DSM 17205 / KCTC 12402 / DSW-6) TaxID=592029 RepID=L7WBY4_NONDD|nr:hypothetical protein DDD_2487 [Nonlabens dokdonensis DSW-6]
MVLILSKIKLSTTVCSLVEVVFNTAFAKASLPISMCQKI